MIEYPAALVRRVFSCPLPEIDWAHFHSDGYSIQSFRVNRPDCFFISNQG